MRVSKEPRIMTHAVLSVRIDAENTAHHLWNNHGVWWVHYTLNSEDGRTRRVRRTLGTRDRAAALARRDALFDRLQAVGELWR
jgi:hypothetical protein